VLTNDEIKKISGGTKMKKFIVVNVDDETWRNFKIKLINDKSKISRFVKDKIMKYLNNEN